MLSFREPVRIIAKNTLRSLTAATMLFGILSDNEIKSAIRIVPNYTKSEMDMLLREDYPSSIVIDCDQPPAKFQSVKSEQLYY